MESANQPGFAAAADNDGPASPQQSKPVRSLTLNGLLFIGTLIILKVGAPLLVPFALAIFLYLLLSPVVSTLNRYWIPRTIAALAVLSLVFGALAIATINFSQPAAKWLQEIPQLAPSIKSKLVPVSEPFAKFEELASEVEELAEIGEESEIVTVKLAEEGIVDLIVSQVPYVLLSLGIVVFVTFFLLVFGDTLNHRIARLGRNFTEQRRLMNIGRHIQKEISRFLGVVTLINVGLGFATGTVFWLLGVPNYMLWGGVAAVANFAPYAGAVAMTVVFTAVGLISFDSLADAVLVPASFLLLTIIEGQVITPLLVGRHLDISPLVVLVAVIFWGYLWGLVGALVAVPIIVCTKIIFSHVPSLRPIAALLSQDLPRRGTAY